MGRLCQDRRRSRSGAHRCRHASARLTERPVIGKPGRRAPAVWVVSTTIEQPIAHLTALRDNIAALRDEASEPEPATCRPDQVCRYL